MALLFALGLFRYVFAISAMPWNVNHDVVGFLLKIRDLPVSQGERTLLETALQGSRGAEGFPRAPLTC